MKNCEPECTSTTGPNFEDPKKTAGPCSPTALGQAFCPPISSDPSCAPWQLDKSLDNCLIDSVVAEALNIGGATLNVYKLLGVHEQGKLIDVTGLGSPLSNGDLPGFPAKNAFDVFVNEWRSIQKGEGVIASALIGYDFGEVRTNDNSRDMYSIDANIRKHITGFAIKQSTNQKNRVTRVRLERSEDGKKWYGVGIAPLPDDDCLNTILMKSSVPSRFWRLRPLEFNGGVTDYWGVQALQMFDNYLATNIDNIQDKIFVENRDRDYAKEPLVLKGSYDLVDVQSELSKFGIELPGQTLTIQINFTQCVAVLGRPIVVGDIIEIPSEAQYTPEMKKILKWMEVTNVTWSTQGYTPGWQATLLSVTVQPAYVSQETQDIFGDLAENNVPNGLGLVDRNNGEDPIFQDFFDMSQTAYAEAKDAVPEKGAEGSSTIRAFEQSEIDAAKAQGVFNLQKIGLNSTGLYVEDAMPPNNAPFTEGETFPTNPKHGDYHRVTYTGLAKNIPARLFRYSSAKGRWMFLESDKRAFYDPEKPTLQEYLTSPNKKNNENITKG